MEKKPTPSASSSQIPHRSSPSSATGNSKQGATESRKANPDSSWPKKGRRRDSNSGSADATNVRQQQKNNSAIKAIPTNNNNPNQFNQNRGQQQQRRGRGGATTGDGHRDGPPAAARSFGSSTTSGSGLEMEAELNSVYLSGSKKHNLNHLLNFNYAPRSAHDDHQLVRSAIGRKQFVRYNKEQYLQAICQFVVRADIDWKPYTQSADQLVEWSAVEQVHVQSTEEPQCPICLYHPVAGKMTRCGHVYCWPCVLHYLALSDKSWRKCPICYEAIHASDLKSSVSKSFANYKVGDTVNFQLMCRPKNSLQVFKMTSGSLASVAPEANAFPHLFSDSGSHMYSKLILADPNEILSIIERERNELMCQLSADGADCPESMFIQQALDLLLERQRTTEVLAVKFDGRKMFKPKSTNAHLDDATTLSGTSLRISAKEFVPTPGTNAIHATEPMDGANFLIDEASQLMLHDIEIQPTAHSDAQHYFFYQSADGQMLYMHSVNVRMLQQEYGSLDRAPLQIRGEMVQKESCSMTEALRKRLKYLQHLPVTSQFEVAEIRLNECCVSDDVFEMFRDELTNRQKMRQRREKEERKREKHINEVNDRQIGKIRERSANIDVMSVQHFPMYSDWDLSPTSYDAISADNPPLEVVEADTVATRVSKKKIAATSSSFARMLTSPKATELWPTLGPAAGTSMATGFPELSSSGRPNSLSDTFGGGPSSSNRSRRTIQVSECESIDEFHNEIDEELAARPPESGPDYGAAIADALNQQALLNSFSEHGRSAPMMNADGGQRKQTSKKKKKRTTLLFSTNVRTYDGN